MFKIITCYQLRNWYKYTTIVWIKLKRKRSSSHVFRVYKIEAAVAKKKTRMSSHFNYKRQQKRGWNWMIRSKRIFPHIKWISAGTSFLIARARLVNRVSKCSQTFYVRIKLDVQNRVIGSHPTFFLSIKS